MYSPGPASMFAIGPYAHETQLVSPPVFSTFTTEPSTAPYTPPPESLHMTTPSSPEVPFARVVEPHLQIGEAGQKYPLSQYEFQSYHLQPGSPVSHLISPSSGISGSGTSSPFPDHPFFLDFRSGVHPKLLELDRIGLCEWESCQGSGTVTPDAVVSRPHDNCMLNQQDSDLAPLPDSNRLQNEETVLNHRVSFEVTDQEVVRCVEKKAGVSPESMPSIEHTGQESCNAVAQHSTGEGEVERLRQKDRTITLGSSKEFNFESVDGGSYDLASIPSSEWWVNEAEDGGHGRNWSFFPMMQTGVS